VEHFLINSQSIVAANIAGAAGIGGVEEELLNVGGGLVVVVGFVLLMLEQSMGLHIPDLADYLLPPATGSVLVQTTAPDATLRQLFCLFLRQLDTQPDLNPLE
jgi:hypothetical protein